MLSKSKIKYIQSLSQKKLRDKEGLFVAEGPKLINELLNEPHVILEELFVTSEWVETHARPMGASWQKNLMEISSTELERISFLTTPNQVLGVFQKPKFKEPLILQGVVTLMLDAIQDPGNLGTIIRCADWFGINQVICSKDCADVFNPKVVQSTMGSIARVRVLYESLEEFIAHHQNIPLYAASLQGTDLRNLKAIKEGMLLIGNESKGISRSLLSHSTQQITIPRKGEAESLNAAVATGIILSHIV